LALMAENSKALTDLEKEKLDENGINFLMTYKLYFATRKFIDTIFSQTEPVGPTQKAAIQKVFNQLMTKALEVREATRDLVNKMPPSARWLEWEWLIKEKLKDRLPAWDDEGTTTNAMTGGWKLKDLVSRIDYLANLIDTIHVIDKSYSDVLDKVGTRFLEGQFLFYETTKLKTEFDRDPLKSQVKKLELNQRLAELGKLEKSLELDYNDLLRLIPNSSRWKLWGEKVAGDKSSHRPEGEWCGNTKNDK